MNRLFVLFISGFMALVVGIGVVTAVAEPIPTLGEYAVFLPIVIHPRSTYEPNNTQDTAFGPLVANQVYEALPEDLDDWYYFVLGETATLHVSVNNYLAVGQLVVYREVCAADGVTITRVLVANDGNEDTPSMSIPNETDPNALEDLVPGTYLIRIYSVTDYQLTHWYQLLVSSPSPFQTNRLNPCES